VPAQHVRPYVKSSNKNDTLDAEGIVEAVERPTMRFVPLKTPEQLDLQALHRLRARGRGRRRRGEPERPAVELGAPATRDSSPPSGMCSWSLG